MEVQKEDLERLVVIEQTRQKATAEYRKNPGNAENLTKLGRALVELSQFAHGSDQHDMLDDAVAHLERAVQAEPRRHEAHWWLGNAHTTHGFNARDGARAGASFERAAECFRLAIQEDPSNEAYKKSLELSLKGPELHKEIQKQFALQQAVTAPVQKGSATQAQEAKKKDYEELLYDAAGWLILAGVAIVWFSILSARGSSAPKI